MLHMRDTGFLLGNRMLFESENVELADGECAARCCGSEQAASALALTAAGIVKATHGDVYIGEFDPRIQPAQAKRLVGFVPYETVPRDFTALDDYVAYRAALWSLDRKASIVRARMLMAQLQGVHESIAIPLAGALLSAPRLIVLDRPQLVYAERIMAVTAPAAVFSTHTSAHNAHAFAARGTLV